MNPEIYSFISMAVLVGAPIVTWCIGTSYSLFKMAQSLKYLNTKLSLIDWDKVPKKSLNDIIK